MALSWAAECFAFLASGRDRAPEKRKVGGSTPPLTTTSQRIRWPSHLQKPREESERDDEHCGLAVARCGWLYSVRLYRLTLRAAGGERSLTVAAACPSC